MDCYVNPRGMTKEEWLKTHGIEISAEDAAEHDNFDDVLLVVLVDNGPFTAAAVAYKRSEVDHFVADPTDTRPKAYYLVNSADLLKVFPRGLPWNREEVV